MHRSGTSAFTRVLNLLGCALPDELVGPGDGNELGHWESLQVVSLNDRILESAGSCWNDWGPLNQDWRKAQVRDDMCARATDVIRAHAALGPLFAIKDPRLCRLADIWFEAMDDAGVEPVSLVLLRNPGEVAASLAHRDLMTPAYGQMLWLRHVLDAEHYSRGRTRVFADFSQLMGDWFGTIERVKAGLDIALPRNSPSVHADIERFLDEGHRHHHQASREILGNPGLSLWLRRTYAIMTSWCRQGENHADHAELDTIRHQFDLSYTAFAPLLLAEGHLGEVGAGSRLKRELATAQAETEAAREAVHLRTQESESRLVAAAAREAELQAQEASLLSQISELQDAAAAANAAARQEQDLRLASEQRLAAVTQALQQGQLRDADIAGRLASTESNLAQRREELAQLWRQLLDAQTALAEAQAEIKAERAMRMSAETGRADLEAALSASHQANARNIENLKAELSEMAQARAAAETARTTAEQKLAVRFDEIATLTGLLVQETTKTARNEADTQWLRDAMQLAASFPRHWSLMPQAWRRQREHARFLRAGLFDAARYLDAYPDVAEDGMDPIRHYILHGIAEGRQRPM